MESVGKGERTDCKRAFSTRGNTRKQPSRQGGKHLYAYLADIVKVTALDHGHDHRQRQVCLRQSRQDWPGIWDGLGTELTSVTTSVTA